MFFCVLRQEQDLRGVFAVVLREKLKESPGGWRLTLSCRLRREGTRWSDLVAGQRHVPEAADGLLYHWILFTRNHMAHIGETLLSNPSSNYGRLLKTYMDENYGVGLYDLVVEAALLTVQSSVVISGRRVKDVLGLLFRQ